MKRLHSENVRFIFAGLITFWFAHNSLLAQRDTITLGFGGQPVTVTASSGTNEGSPVRTMSQEGYLPNENASSRFLQHAALGHGMSDINAVASMGYTNWIDSQRIEPRAFTILDKIRQYHQIIRDSTNSPTASVGSRAWRYAWWQYFMTSPDKLRQRVALA